MCGGFMLSAMATAEIIQKGTPSHNAKIAASAHQFLSRHSGRSTIFFVHESPETRGTDAGRGCAIRQRRRRSD